MITTFSQYYTYISIDTSDIAFLISAPKILYQSRDLEKEDNENAVNQKILQINISI